MPEQTVLFSELISLSSDEVGLAVLGYPIVHSISPQIHRAALKVLAEKESEFNRWNYRKIEVFSQNLPIALPKLAELGFRGLNLTIPHKVEVLPLLSSIDAGAKMMGAVNTLSWEKDGWKGYNTDGFGLSFAIQKAFQKSLDEFNILVLGAGGAARAAVAQCLLEGCENLAIFNRSVERAYELLNNLLNNGMKQKLSVLDNLSNPFAANQSPLLVINATSLGLREDDPSPIELSLLSGNIFVYDMVYNPPMTSLLNQARELGFPYSNGMGMLVGQAARSLEIWTERKVSIDAMSQAAVLALAG